MINSSKLIMMFIFCLLLANDFHTILTENVKNSVFERMNNPNFDFLTGILHHAQHTKTCDSNLQTLGIDFHIFWNNKFETYVNKAKKLGSALTHLILEHNQNNEYLKRIDTSLISSYNYFVFSNNDIDSLKAKHFSLKFSNDIKNKTNVALNDIKDKFIISYGVIFHDNGTYNFDNNKYSKCIHISKEGIHSNRLRISKICSSFESSNFEDDVNDKKFTKYGFQLFDGKDLIDENAEHKMKTCNLWYKTLYNSYKKTLTINLNNESYTKSDNDYAMFLKQLTQNKEFAKTQWCGPYYECTSKSNNWVILYSTPLFGINKEFKGALMFKFNLTNLDINQCDDSDDILFSKTHKCKKNTKCVFKPNGFKLGGYSCLCVESQNTQHKLKFYKGADLEREYWSLKNMKKNTYNESFNCIECIDHNCCQNVQINRNISINSIEDETFVSDTNEQYFNDCKFNYNQVLRKVFLVIQCIMIIITFLIGIVVYKSRKQKVIQNSVWILLEIILFGMVLLYSTVLMQTFEPNDYNCIVSIWMRELGFSIVYGTINLRLYKILTEFQSRKAHCIQLKDKDLLKLLGFIVMCVVGYLLAWTLVDLDYSNQGYSLLTKVIDMNALKYRVCRVKWWNYFIQIVELLCIFVGIYLLIRTRFAPSEFHERKLIAIVIYLEAFVSISLNLIKHLFLQALHPDIVLVLYFIQCHLTITVMIFLLFLIKFYILLQPKHGERIDNTRASVADGLNFNFGISKDLLHTKSIENEAIDAALVDIGQDDIKAELKRLYTQLHIQKIQSLRIDNPHVISKKKPNRKNRRLSHTPLKQLIRDSESITAKTPEETSSNDVTTNNYNNNFNDC